MYFLGNDTNREQKGSENFLLSNSLLHLDVVEEKHIQNHTQPQKHQNLDLLQLVG